MGGKKQTGKIIKKEVASSFFPKKKQNIFVSFSLFYLSNLHLNLISFSIFNLNTYPIFQSSSPASSPLLSLCLSKLSAQARAFWARNTSFPLLRNHSLHYAPLHTKPRPLFNILSFCIGCFISWLFCSILCTDGRVRMTKDDKETLSLSPIKGGWTTIALVVFLNPATYMCLKTSYTVF